MMPHDSAIGVCDFGNRAQQESASLAFQSGSGGMNACSPQSGGMLATSLTSFAANNQIASTNARGVATQPYYDESGDVLSDGANQYLYDAEGRICAVSSTVAGVTMMTGYMYDADGTRVSKGAIQQWSCNPTTAQYATQTDYILGLGGEQFSEYAMQPNNTLAWVHTNVWAVGRLLATYAQGSTSSQPMAGLLHFYLDDPLGTRRAQTDFAGNPEQTCSSLPYGDAESCAPSPTEHLFTGKERDIESGNDYFGARYYASTMGRWMSPDWSVKVMPVPYAKLDNPQSLNLYAYVGNNPLIRFDVDGHYDCQGDKKQCQTFKDALAIVQKADSALKEGSKERKQLDSVLKFYGTDNGKGPAIKFGDLSPFNAVGITQTDHGKTTITFDAAALGGMSKVGQGETTAHEGTHGRDDHRPGVGAGLFWKFYDTEYHAYQSESYVDMGLGKASETDEHPSWAPGMSYSDHVKNITRDAYDNAGLDCKNAGCAP